MINFPSAITAYFGWAKQKDSEMNNPDMRDNSIALQDQALKKKFTENQMNGDIDAIRRTDSH